MNLFIYQEAIFRDKTRLRCTKNGRLLIRREVAKSLNIENEERLSYTVIADKTNTRSIIIMFGRDSGGSCVKVTDIKGVKSIALKRVIKRYIPLMAQYADYRVVQNELYVTIKSDYEDYLS